MPNLEKFQTVPIVCEGGWNSNQNHILLSQRTPGAATTLINFETSLFGGYRRIEGFESLNGNSDYTEVDVGGAEGKILGLAIYDGEIIAMRKTLAISEYKFYRFIDGSAWDPYVTGTTQSSLLVNKVRYATWTFSPTTEVGFVDGTNPLTLHDGTNWVQAVSTNTGADFANAGGPQILDAPSLISVFFNHVFISGDTNSPNVISHSSPNSATDWTAASGAGQILCGFNVVAIRPFRDALYVWGETSIKKVVIEADTFVLKDVAQNIGCLAADSVQEINGDIIFLSQDGFRTIAATERNEDVELGSLSKIIQQDVIDEVLTADLPSINSVVIRRKSQVRFFFSDEQAPAASNTGFIGCIKGDKSMEHEQVGWEWSQLLGIRTTAATSSYIDEQEFVIHGDIDGRVYRQEQGSSFAGENIRAVYTMPYLDLGDVFVRKTVHKVTVFLRPESSTVTLTGALQFDWGLPYVFDPVNYLFENSVSGTVYGVGIYNISTYATAPTPIVMNNVSGSGESFRMTFSTFDTSAPYSIQAVIFELALNGRK